MPADPRRPTKKRPSGRPFTKGDPRRGPGPKKGAPNAGRPPEWFKQQLAAGLTRDETVAAVHRILGDDTHPHFAQVLKWAADRVLGRVATPVEHSGEVRSGVVLIPATLPAGEWAAAAAAQQAALTAQVGAAATAAERAAGHAP